LIKVKFDESEEQLDMNEIEVRYMIAKDMYKNINFKRVMKFFYSTNKRKMFILKIIELAVIIAVFLMGKTALSMLMMNEKTQATLRFLSAMTVFNTCFVLFQEYIGMFFLVIIYKCKLRRLLPQEIKEIIITFTEKEFILNHPNVQKKIPYLKVYMDNSVLYLGGGLFPLERKGFCEEDWDNIIQFCRVHGIV